MKKINKLSKGLSEKQLSPVEFHKKIDSQINKGISAKDILSLMQESTDVKEKILKEVVDKLFSKEHLLMISRLDNNLAYYLIKLLIIEGFYNNFYYNLKYEVTISPSDKPPFYKTEVTYKDVNVDLIIKNSYHEFIDKLQMITISFKGQGREELIKLYDALNERIRKEESNAHLLKNLGLTG
jgi:hypothetical protein